VLVVIGPRIQAWAQERVAKAGQSAEHIFAWPDGRGGVEHFSRSPFYGGYFTAAQGILLVGRDGCTAAGIGAADERREEPADIDRESCCGRWAYTMVAFHRINWAVAGLIAIRVIARRLGWVHAMGRRLSPNALRAVIVIVGLIGLYRLLTV